MSKSAIFGLLFMAAAVDAQAGTTLICKVKESLVDGRETSYERRIEINEETRYFKSQINTGSGFKPGREGKIQSIDDQRIDLRNDNEIRAYVDRTTGDFYMKIYSSNAVHRGSCKKQEAGNRMF